MTDFSIIFDGIRKRDKLAFEKLYQLEFSGYCKYAAAILGNFRDATEDVVDDAFFTIWKKIEQFDGRGNPRGWMLRIVRNQAIDFLRSRGVKNAGLESPVEQQVEIADANDSPEEVLIKKQNANELNEAIARLSIVHREVIWLSYFEALSIKEIAQISDCPENTVKTRLHHARISLKRILEAFDYE